MTSDLCFKAIYRNDSIVTYEEAEPFTTKAKTIEFPKATRHLGHNPKVALKEGIEQTVRWMTQYYRVEK